MCVRVFVCVGHKDAVRMSEYIYAITCECVWHTLYVHATRTARLSVYVYGVHYTHVRVYARARAHAYNYKQWSDVYVCDCVFVAMREVPLAMIY